MPKHCLNFFLLAIILSSCSGKAEDQKSDLSNLEHLVSKIENRVLIYKDEIDRLKVHYEFLINNRDSLLPLIDTTKYQFIGGYSTNHPESDTTLSTIFISTQNLNLEKAKEEVALTNGLDSVFLQLYTQHDLIAQVYSNSATNVSRVYPSYDAQNLISPEIDITSFNFYYEADEKHNPGKGPVWIPEAYIDPAGSGWIFSLIQPVYDQNKLFAVLGIDFTIDSYIQYFLDQEIGRFLIINRKGDIVAGKSSAIEALSMPPLKNHVYRETIKMDSFRISDFNLFNSKSKEVRQMAKSILFENNDKYTFYHEKGLTNAMVYPFKIVDWYLLELH